MSDMCTPSTIAIMGIDAATQLHLVDQESVQERRNVLFRYDSPVLIVGVTWHEKSVGLVESLYLSLKQAYAGHEDWVCIGVVEDIFTGAHPICRS